MPMIRGRYYANPAFGEALERARQQDAEYAAVSEQHHAPPQPHTPQHHAPPPTATGRLANRIYNESAGLRPTASQGLGSADDLHNGRVFMGHVIRNREAVGKPGKVAPDHLAEHEAQAVKTYPPARAAYQDSQAAAERARSEPDRTRGATNFYLDFGQGPPPWTRGKTLVGSFGPFLNSAGGGDVPRGAKTRIVILR